MRDVPTRTITRSFAPAPLDDFLFSGRADWRPSDRDAVGFRYAGEHATDTGASTLDRSIGSASQRQRSENSYNSIVGTWTRIVRPTLLNALTGSFSTFDNAIAPVAGGPQLTFPSIQDGSSFRVPQGTTQKRFQITDSVTMVRGSHTLRAGGEWQRIDALFDLGVFLDGRIEMVEDFATFDHNGDGRVDDNDLLFAVTLRSGKPNQALVIPDADNNYFAFYVQDDWRVRPDLTLNLGLRWEGDTDVKNISRYDEINPIVQPFLQGERNRDSNNFGPRIGFNWAPGDGRFSLHGGYGIYYDRITLEIQSLERGLDGRALPIEVKAGNVFFLDPNTGQFPPFAPSISQSLHRLRPDRRRRLGDQHHRQLDAEPERPAVEPRRREGPAARHRAARRWRAQPRHALHHRPHDRRGVQPGGRRAGSRRQPRVEREHALRRAVRIRRAARDGLRLPDRLHLRQGAELRQRRSDPVRQRADQSDQPAPRVRPDAERPAPQLHAGRLGKGPAGILLAPIVRLASGVPMDILLPDASSRIPAFQRNAGGRQFETGAELNAALQQLNAQGGVNGLPLPLVRDDVRFSDGFAAVDLRVSRPFTFGKMRVEPIVEVFNLFNVTNILGVGVKNYSGYSNVLVRDSQNPQDPGFMRSSSFGEAVNTAGGVFGSGGPRAFQFAVRATF